MYRMRGMTTMILSWSVLSHIFLSFPRCWSVSDSCFTMMHHSIQLFDSLFVVFLLNVISTYCSSCNSLWFLRLRQQWYQCTPWWLLLSHRTGIKIHESSSKLWTHQLLTQYRNNIRRAYKMFPHGSGQSTLCCSGRAIFNVGVVTAQPTGPHPPPGGPPKWLSMAGNGLGEGKMWWEKGVCVRSRIAEFPSA